MVFWAGVTRYNSRKCIICNNCLQLDEFDLNQIQITLLFSPMASVIYNVSYGRWLLQELLYSWRFSCYRAPIHWLVHCHMTSNNETVSRQMPWAGNVAKTMTSNRKWFNVTCEMLTAVACHLSITWLFVFHRLTHLPCYITNHLMTGPLGNSEFCFPRISMFSGNIEILGKQNSLFPSGPVIKCLLLLSSREFISITSK